MPYIKFSTIEFTDIDTKKICKTILKDIQILEYHVMRDDEYAHYLRKMIGAKASESIKGYFSVNYKILLGLKTTFWYYTGINPSHVILDCDKFDEEIKVNIFDPLQ